MSFFRNRIVAVTLTGVMVVLAILIGLGKGGVLGGRTPEPGPAGYGSFVYDDAGVLSSSVENELDRLNERMYDNFGAVVAVVTCNYGRSDLGDYAMDYAEDIGLSGYDFIVVLDISGDNYWLIQGYDLTWDFTDEDCSDYAYEYMEYDFARGDYGDAALNLAKALYDWYDYNYYY